MIRRPPRSTRTDTLFPYTTLFRSETVAQVQRCRQGQVDDLHVRVDRVVAAGPGVVVFGLQAERGADHRAEGDVFELAAERLDERHRRDDVRSEEHTSELQSLMRISYAVFCLTKKNILSTST